MGIIVELKIVKYIWNKYKFDLIVPLEIDSFIQNNIIPNLFYDQQHWNQLIESVTSYDYDIKQKKSTAKNFFILVYGLYRKSDELIELDYKNIIDKVPLEKGVLVITGSWKIYYLIYETN